MLIYIGYIFDVDIGTVRGVDIIRGSGVVAGKD
jgi:hypothetical protein